MVGADVGEDETPDSTVACKAAHLECWRMTTCTSRESDRTSPACHLGEHEMGTHRPGWERKELGCPHDPFVVGLDEISDGGVARVFDRQGLDRAPGPATATADD